MILVRSIPSLKTLLESVIEAKRPFVNLLIWNLEGNACLIPIRSLETLSTSKLEEHVLIFLLLDWRRGIERDLERIRLLFAMCKALIDFIAIVLIDEIALSTV